MVVLVFELKINFLNFGTKVHYGFFNQKWRRKNIATESKTSNEIMDELRFL